MVDKKGPAKDNKEARLAELQKQIDALMAEREKLKGESYGKD